MAVVARAGDLGHLAPDHLHVRKTAAVAAEVQPRARDGGATGVVRSGFGVAEVDEPVAGVTRMQDHVAQAALAAIGHGGHAGDLAELAVADVQQPQPARLLGDQQPAVGQEGHRPGFVEARDLGAGEWRVRQPGRGQVAAGRGGRPAGGRYALWRKRRRLAGGGRHRSIGTDAARDVEARSGGFGAFGLGRFRVVADEDQVAGAEEQAAAGEDQQGRAHGDAPCGEQSGFTPAARCAALNTSRSHVALRGHPAGRDDVLYRAIRRNARARDAHPRRSHRRTG